MMPRRFSRKMFCAVAVAAFASGGAAGCGKDDSGNGSASEANGVKVTYEISSTTAKPFRVTYIEKTDSDSAADLEKTMATATAASSWKKEVVLSKGTDYAMVVVTPDLTNFDTATRYSCKIVADGKTVDEKKDQQGVIGCAGLKLRDQVKKAGSSS
ncbi:hypothetical protein [Segniliparus rugosus]|uniref:Lipoprotein n=1 Tax=Segniliparus rugosus (strain ATCC BAA-974 / DSM 45345 / CCUG 50838 / CIP 108380 / JCM 13579 / CDC 945) TaxID=679197 RepID=E5XL77_SEGRC|nr:hypothetical protein [Segniliparus rugosus]EFV14893.1 hypothetical protein HMPREF9336_00246 [Segniliparus rugosus ATCC BAA-974]